MPETIVLAYSGGLDTTVAVKWLIEERGFEVVALTIDLYSDDWTLIKGAMVQGRARLYPRGTRFRAIRALLYKKYPQYRREAAISESDSVVVEVTPTRVFSWGVK